MITALVEVEIPLRKIAAEALEAERQREIEREREEAQRRTSLLTDNLQILSRRILGFEIPARMIEVIDADSSLAKVIATVDGVRLTASELRMPYGAPALNEWRLHLLIRCERCGQDNYRRIWNLADLGATLVTPAEAFICDCCRNTGEVEE